MAAGRLVVRVANQNRGQNRPYLTCENRFQNARTEFDKTAVQDKNRDQNSRTTAIDDREQNRVGFFRTLFSGPACSEQAHTAPDGDALMAGQIELAPGRTLGDGTDSP